MSVYILCYIVDHLVSRPIHEFYSVCDALDTAISLCPAVIWYNYATEDGYESLNGMGLDDSDWKITEEPVTK